MEEKYYFIENENKYTHEMLDKHLNNNPKYVTLRQYLIQFINDGYFSFGAEYIDCMTTSQLSHAVDWIEYLETK